MSTEPDRPTSQIPFPASSDHLIRSGQHIWWNRETDLFRCLEIDYKLKLRRLLDRQIGGLGPFEDLVHIRSGAPVQVVLARAVGHKPPGAIHEGQAKKTRRLA